MNIINRKLQIEQLNKKIKYFGKLDNLQPTNGWLHSTRTTLGMSLSQLGKAMKISVQSVKELETREKEGTASLKLLDEAARALNLKLVYGFAPIDKDLKQIINAKAQKVAKDIVLRTHKTMALEDQANTRSRLRRAIKEKTEEIINYKIKSLWD